MQTKNKGEYMSNQILNNLLKEYDKKRIKAELDLEERKESLYSSIPRLKQIEDELNNYAINTAKELLPFIFSV